MAKWMKLKEGGMSLADAIQQRRDFCNPYMLAMLIEYNGLDEYGSAFPPELWDPAAIPPEDSPEALERAHAELAKRREEERRASGKVDFAPGGVQQPMGGVRAASPAPPGGGVLPGGQLSAVSAAAAAAIAKAKATAAALPISRAQAPAKPRRPSKWDNAANPLLK